MLCTLGSLYVYTETLNFQKNQSIYLLVYNYYDIITINKYQRFRNKNLKG